MEAITREEKIMSGENLTPITRKEMFLAKAAGQNIETPEPITREEMFLSKISGGAGGGGGDDWIKSFTEGSAVQLQREDITSVADYKFRKDTSITDVDLPNVSTIGQYAFSEATALESLNLSNTVTLNAYAFKACTALKTAIIPNASSNGEVFYGCTALEHVDISNSSWGAGDGIYGSVFYNCSNLSTVKADKCRIIGKSSFWGCKSLTKVRFPCVYRIGSNAFRFCSALSQIDFGENAITVPSIDSYAFADAYSLKAIIMRYQTMYKISNQNAFDSCHHFHGTVNETYNPNGLKDGYIYVPSALVEKYKSETNWSTFADQFRALEDYTVDGTITGELDESKI